MTLYDLARLIRQNATKIASVGVVCAMVCFLCSGAYSLMKPSYKATSTIVSIGGSFSSTAGIANHIASQESKDGVTVSASPTSSNSTVTFSATAASVEAAKDACNNAANETGKQAKDSGAVNSYSVTEATSAKSTSKSPLLLGAFGFMGGAFAVVTLIALRTSIRGIVLSPKQVEELGLFYLGCVDAKPFHAGTIVANICFKSRKREDDERSRVLLHPTNKNVRVNEVGNNLSAEAGKIGMTLKKTPPLEESARTLYQGSEAEAVVVIVEEGKSTFNEIEEIEKEFEVAGINTAGFVFLPHKAQAKKAAAAGHRARKK